MTEDHSSTPADDAVLPRGSQESFLILCGAAFLVVAAVLFGYGQYGGVLAAGIDEACAEASFLSGQRLEELGNYDQAVRRYQQALDGRFADVERRYACARAIGDLLVRENRYAEALQAYSDLPGEAFNGSGAYTGYVTALIREGQLEDAETSGLVWLKLANEEGNAQQQLWANEALMRICQQNERIDEAIAYGRAAVANSPDSGVQLSLAALLQRAGDLEGARACLDALMAATQDTQLIDAAKKMLRTLG